MEQFILDIAPDAKALFLIFSIILNVIIAILGVVPSAFLTAANIVIFGFELGLLISIIGEAFGAIVSFILYRKGVNKLTAKMENKNKFLQKLQTTKGVEAVFLVLILRILPFAPSGVVTLAAAYSKMGLISFSIASTIGKIPSLYIEAYAVNHALNLSSMWQIGILLVLLAGYLLYWLINKRKGRKQPK